MTVVAYSSKHRILATDSRIADANTGTVTTGQKLYQLKSGALLGISGDADHRDIVRLLETSSPRKMVTRAQLVEAKCDFEAVLVFQKGQLFTVQSTFHEWSNAYGEWTGEVLSIRDPFVALGAGQDFAAGAMEHGASPIEAVRIACRRNAFCALPVQWEKLK